MAVEPMAGLVAGSMAELKTGLRVGSVEVPVPVLVGWALEWAAVLAPVPVVKPEGALAKAPG